MSCDNCGRHHDRPDDVCLLSAIGGIVVDRGHSDEDVCDVINNHLGCKDSDDLWNMLAPVVDWLEDKVEAVHSEEEE